MPDVRLPDGRMLRFPDGTTEAEITAEVNRLDEGTPAPARASAPAPLPPPPSNPALDFMGRGVVASAEGQMRLSRDVAALVARYGPSFIPNPLISGPASAIGEAAAQVIEGAPFDPVAVAVAGALPPVFAAGARGVRGLTRTATRLSPTLFERTQANAIKHAAEVVDQLRPPVSAGPLFRAARAEAGERVSLPSLKSFVDDVDALVDKAPVDVGLQKVRAALDKIKPALEGTDAPLGELMKWRLDLGRVIQHGGAPEIKAIYKGIITDLEAAAARGGTGASAYVEALDVFKKDLGASKFADLVKAASSKTRLGNLDALNINRLSKAVKGDDELARLLGADGMKTVEAFIKKFGNLPPTHAYTAANAMISATLGAAGAFGAGGTGLAVGLLGRELASNAMAVGKNPAQLNRLMNVLAQVSKQVATLNTPKGTIDLGETFRGATGLPLSVDVGAYR